MPEIITVTIPGCNTVTFYNTEQIATCPVGKTGDPVTIAAGLYSGVTQEAANAAALAAAQAQLRCCADCPDCPPSEDCSVLTGPLSSAVYDSSRDVIFAAGNGYVYKLNATTGAIISSVRFSVPNIGDSYITYAPAVDKLFVTHWLYLDTYATNQNFYQINPDTLAIEGFAAIPGGTSYGSGPRSLFALGLDVYGVYVVTGSVGGRAWRYNGVGAVFTNSATFGFYSVWNNCVYDPDANGIWILRSSGITGATFLATGTLATGTSVSLTTINSLPTAVAYRSGFLYFTMAERGDTLPQKILKKKSDNTGVIITIDMGRPDAFPFNIKHNPVNDRIYVPTWLDNTVVIIDPTNDTVESVKTGFDSPFDVVFTPTKAFAVQQSRQGLKEIV